MHTRISRATLDALATGESWLDAGAPGAAKVITTATIARPPCSTQLHTRSPAVVGLGRLRVCMAVIAWAQLLGGICRVFPDSPSSKPLVWVPQTPCIQHLSLFLGFVHTSAPPIVGLEQVSRQLCRNLSRLSPQHDSVAC